MLLFALDASREFGAAVAAQLGQPLAVHEERTFEDGEHKIRPLVDPDGKDVFVVQSLHGSRNSVRTGFFSFSTERSPRNTHDMWVSMTSGRRLSGHAAAEARKHTFSSSVTAATPG